MNIDRVARRLSLAVLSGMLIQALTGILFADVYRDVEWIKASWYGNDWVTLVAACPLLLFGLTRAGAGLERGFLVWLGLMGYALYNYAFYLLGAALNALFPLYLTLVVTSAIVLIVAFQHLDVSRIAASVRPRAPIRFVGASLFLVGFGLASVWIATWAAYVFAGRPTMVEPEVFKLVAALDLSLMVPALGAAGVLVWRRTRWGFVWAAIASIQAALYLLVLSVNSLVLARRGLASFPGELPIWGPLTILTGVVAMVVLMNVQNESVHQRARTSQLP